MKEKKTTTAVLLTATILIWGMIAIRAVHWMHPKQEMYEKQAAPQPQTVPLRHEPVSIGRDPFLKHISPEREKSKQTATAATARTKEQTDPSFIFKGIMNCSGIGLAIVMRGDEAIILKRGDTIDGFKVDRFNHNELILTKNGKKTRLEVKR